MQKEYLGPFLNAMYKSKKLSILLLGGTGAMGGHLTEILAEQGHDVVVTSRRERESKHKNVKYIIGNAHDEQFVLNLLNNNCYDALVDFMVYKTEEFKCRVDNLCSKVGQYVFLSSARVYADSEDLITEESPRWLDVCKDSEYLKTDEYALSKAREENILKDSIYRNWTIIRPYITYSESRLQLGVMEKEAWLYRCVHGRTIVFSKDIASKFTTLTYGYDVSRGIAAVIGYDKALGEAFHITQPHTMTWSDILNIYLEEIESQIGMCPCVLMTDIALNMRYVGTKWQVKMDRQLNRRFDSSKINHFIDVNTFVKPHEGLRKCVRALLNQNDMAEPDWKMEALKDKLCNQCASMSEFSSKKMYAHYLIWRYFVLTCHL